MRLRRTTRRRSRRRSQATHPVILLTGLIVALAAFHAVIGVIGLVLAVAAITAAAYYAGTRTRPVTRARTRKTPAAGKTATAREITTERDQLRRDLRTLTAERNQLQRDLCQARTDARQHLAVSVADITQIRTDASEATARADQYQEELSRIRGQIDALEDAAGRPIEAIITTYRHVQRQYGPSATPGARKTSRS